MQRKEPQYLYSWVSLPLAHLVASQANDSFSQVAGINVEDFLIDIFYWFDKSSKRKGKLAEYFEFCNQEYQKILKHISICWLSLERCIDQVLKKLLSLKLYFESEHFADAHFQRLHAAISNPIFQSVLLFHSASVQLFTNFNKLLEREEPTIHKMLCSALLRN